MGTSKVQLSPTARTWMRAFVIGILFSQLARRFFPDLMPWSSDLPRSTQAILLLFTGIVVGVALQGAWWLARRASRGRDDAHAEV